MSTLVESGTGAQVLPRPKVSDERRTVTEWQAHCACDADLRAKHTAYAQVAARLFVLPGEGVS